MVRTRFDNLDPEKQEAMLAAAAEEFAERGYEAASLNRIVEAAGISKGSLYYYFENKADLFATVVKRAGEKVSGPGLGWVEELTADGFWDTLREMSRRSLRQLERDEWYLKVAQSFFRLLEEPAAREATARALEDSQRMGHALLARGQELGVVRTDLPLPMLVELLMGVGEAADRWMLRRWDDLTEEETADLMDAYVNLLRDMLGSAREGRDS